MRPPKGRPVLAEAPEKYKSPALSPWYTLSHKQQDQSSPGFITTVMPYRLLLLFF